jgi:hypothetical protein
MRIVAALLVSPALLAQTLSFGVRAGLPTTDVFTVDWSRHASTQRYTIGPIIEIDLWRGAAIGADFLLQSATLTAAASSTTVKRWELPVTFVYRLRPLPARPFVRAGLSLNRIFDTGDAVECARGPFGEQFYCLNGSPLAELRHRSTYGPVIGGGLQFRFKRMRLEAEARLTRWIDRNFGVRDSAVQSNLTQIEILAGVTF